MIDAIQIDDLKQRFGGQPPDPDRDLCLNRHHRQAGCTRCRDICPTQAIDLAMSTPVVLEDRCVHCAGCVAVCPTGAFGPEQRAERLLLRSTENLSSPPLALVCGVHPQPESSPLPVAKILRHRRCLAALSLPHLLTLCADGTRPLWVDDSPCPNCPIGSAHAQLAETVVQANQILAIAGADTAIYLASESPETARNRQRSRPLIDGQQLQISRRGLFSGLSKTLRGSSVTSKDGTLAELKLEAEVSSSLPPSRIALLRWLARHVPASARGQVAQWVSTAQLPFAAVQVDGDDCSGCGLCARICPTDALVFDGSTLQLSQPCQPFALTFQPTLCIDCGICAIICPEKAITFGQMISLQSLSPEFTSQLVTGELVPCSDCKAPTARSSTNQSPLCHTCHSLNGRKWSDDPFA